MTRQEARRSLATPQVRGPLLRHASPRGSPRPASASSPAPDWGVSWTERPQKVSRPGKEQRVLDVRRVFRNGELAEFPQIPAWLFSLLSLFFYFEDFFFMCFLTLLFFEVKSDAFLINTTAK